MPGSNKILLTLQRPVMRAVFHDTFERIRAAMMFQNAFPNVYDTIEFITDNIIRAAESVDQATNIFNRLVLDGEYTTRMTRLVSPYFTLVVEYNITDQFFSLEHVFPFSAERSRSIALRLSKPNSWPFVHTCRSFNWLRSSCPTTITHFQRCLV